MVSSMMKVNRAKSKNQKLLLQIHPFWSCEQQWMKELCWGAGLNHQLETLHHLQSANGRLFRGDFVGCEKTVGEFCDASAACLAPEKVEACVIVKSNLALSRDMGFGNKWEMNVWLIDWFLLASLTKWLILVYVEYWLLKNQKLKNWTSQNKLLWSMKGIESLRI